MEIKFLLKKKNLLKQVFAELKEALKGTDTEDIEEKNTEPCTSFYETR